MSENGQPTTYRFVELTQQHQVTVLRQAILQREQQLYALSVQEAGLAVQRQTLLEDLRRLTAEVEAIVKPAGRPAPEPEPAEEAP
jgi:hypothetical protein